MMERANVPGMNLFEIDPNIFDQSSSLLDEMHKRAVEAQCAYLAAVDDKLGNLMGQNIHPDRILIEKRPGPKTTILVDGMAVAEFTLAITADGNNLIADCVL